MAESVLASCITVWYGNCSASGWQALRWVIMAAQRTFSSSLPTIRPFATADAPSGRRQHQGQNHQTEQQHIPGHVLLLTEQFDIVSYWGIAAIWGPPCSSLRCLWSYFHPHTLQPLYLYTYLLLLHFKCCLLGSFIYILLLVSCTTSSEMAIQHSYLTH